MFRSDIVISNLNSHKALQFLSSITRELNERLKSDKKLKESEERLRLMIDAVKDYAIFMLDRTGHIESWNQGAQRLKGYSPDEIIGRHFSIFYEQNEIKMGKCEYELSEAAIKGRFEDEGWRLKKDGSRFWANVVITALRDSQNRLRGFAKITRDMTERRLAEERLLLANQNLEEKIAERTRELVKAVDSRDEFISIASHELRTPVTALSLQQQVLERQFVKFPERKLDPLQIIQVNKRQISQLEHLVEDMLDVSRESFKLNRVSINLSEILRALTPSLKNLAKDKTVEFKPEVADDVFVLGDRVRIEQVISNLFSNALKYGAGTPVTLSLTKKSNFASLTVHNSGPVIDSRDQTRIFEKFERACVSSKVGGLGLGLFIAKKIVEAHSGRIFCTSTVQDGTHFVVEIPLGTQK